MKDDMKMLYPKVIDIVKIANDRSNIRNELQEQNTRLQSELDKTIKQLKDYEKALKEYACEFCYSDSYDNFDRSSFICEYNGKDYTNNELAQETLKKWEDK